MKLSKKLQTWVDQGFISQKQADKIMESEQSQHSGIMWRLMFGLAGLLIGIGSILIISSNWRNIPAPIKLLGDFSIWGGSIYGAYWSIVNKKDKLKELFLVLSFLFVAATIGLIAQIFNLSGGWHSFAITWAVLGFIYVIFSRLIAVNIAWLCVLFSGIDPEYVAHILEHLFKDHVTMGLITGTVFFGLLTYIGNQLYKIINKAIVMPRAFSFLSFASMYGIAVIGGAIVGFEEVIANIFVFVFLGIRLLLAMYNKNIQSFIRNTHLIELYILFLFLTRYHNLFMSGIGCISGGLLLLGVLYLLKKTSKYIKAMEVFHE